MHAAWIESGDISDTEESECEGDSGSSSDSQTTSSHDRSNHSDKSIGMTDDGKGV